MSFASGIPSGAASSALGAAARQVPLGRPWRRADPPAASPSSAAVSSPPASVRRCGCLPRGPGRPYHDREAVISIKAAFLRTHLPWPPQAQDSPTAEASISILRSQVSVLRRADGSLPSCSMSADATPSVSLSATWANAAPRAWRRACSCCRLSGRLPSARAPPGLPPRPAVGDRDRIGVRHVPAQMFSPLGTTRRASGPQPADQLLSQHLPGLDKQASVDRLRRYPQTLIVGMGSPEPAGDLLG